MALTLPWPLHQIDIIAEYPEVKVHFIRMHGLLTLLESLQSVRSREVVGLELRILNLVSRSHL